MHPTLHRPTLAAHVLVLTARTAAGVLVPVLVTAAVDAVLHGRDGTGPLTVLAAVLLGVAAAEVTTVLLAARITGGGTARLQVRCVEHLLRRHHLGRHGVPLPAGDAVARVVQSTAQTAAAPVAVAGAAVATAGALAGLVMLWVVDPPTGLAFTLSAPCAIVLARRFVGDVGRVQRSYLAAQSTIADRLVTALGGIRTIRAAGSVADETRRVLDARADLSTAGRGIWAVQRTAIWRLDLLIAAVELVVLATAGLGVAAGRVQPAELVAVVAYVGIAMAGFDQIDTLLTVGQARAAADRVATLLAGPEPVDGHRRLPAGPGTLRLRGVGIDGELDEVDLEVPGGTALALVGRTGSGTSALAALLGRLAEPDRGEISLDDVPLPDVRLDDLRRAVSYAFAEPVLVGATAGATVGDVIGHGPHPLPTERVRAAARAARADGFIRRLPLGYDTPLARAPMSGGELQRVGLARALARDARVYVLDDALSGLDAATEAAVRATLHGSFAGRTRVVVAHRAATAADCDLVAWMDGPRLRAVAPHDVLLLDPDYRAIFATDPEVRV